MPALAEWMHGDGARGRLVGRDRELKQIASARAVGDCSGVVLAGEAAFEWAQATRSAATIPLAAFVDLVPPDALRAGEPCPDALVALSKDAGATRMDLTALSEADTVAELAAGGRSNAEIAAQLTISVRTVESHLYHAMGKLGASRRDELNTHLNGGGASRDPAKTHG